MAEAPLLCKMWRLPMSLVSHGEQTPCVMQKTLANVRAPAPAGCGTVKCVNHEELINKAAEALAAAAPPQSRIILFGSHARGEAAGDSDLDFLVVEPEIDGRLEEAIRLR